MITLERVWRTLDKFHGLGAWHLRLEGNFKSFLIIPCALMSIFTNLNTDKNRQITLLPVGLEPTSPSFRGRCLNHLDTDIFHCIFVYLTWNNITMFRLAREYRRLHTIIITRPTNSQWSPSNNNFCVCGVSKVTLSRQVTLCESSDL